jgi:glycosyltransferase involved in cell wall biosynthesis
MDNGVSIIVPYYNDVQNIAETLGSCLVQDVPIEVIVVNDASSKYPITFYYIELIKAIAKQYIVNKENVGLAEARDIGIDAARYDYIICLDTQDWLYPHILGKMLNAIQDADIIYGDMTERDDGKILSPPGKNGITMEGMKKLNQLWCTSLFRKSIWKEVGGYKNGLHTSYEDYFLYNKCLMTGAKFKYIPETIYRHTYNPNSMLSQLHKRTDYYNELARQPLYKNNLMYEL